MSSADFMINSARSIVAPARSRSARKSLHRRGGTAVAETSRQAGRGRNVVAIECAELDSGLVAAEPVLPRHPDVALELGPFRGQVHFAAAGPRLKNGTPRARHPQPF